MVSCDTSKMSPLSHSESIFVATSPGIVYDLVSDITRTTETCEAVGRSACGSPFSSPSS